MGDKEAPNSGAEVAAELTGQHKAVAVVLELVHMLVSHALDGSAK